MRASRNTLHIHPACAIVWCALAMVCAMAFVQPALAAIAVVSVAALGLALDGWRTFLKRLSWQLPVVVGIAILNCVFVQRGATVLFEAGPFALHAESLAYGLCMGAALVCVMEVFSLAGEVVSGDEALSFASGRFPATAMLTSMTLRLVPKMRRDASEYRDAMRANAGLLEGVGGQKGSAAFGLRGRVRSASNMMSTIVANSLEDSLVSADSMRARGYGSGMRRTSYMRRDFSRADAVQLTIVVALGALAVVSGIVSMESFAFYPRIAGGAGLLECVAYAAFFLLPLAAMLVNHIVWRRADSGRRIAREAGARSTEGGAR